MNAGYQPKCHWYHEIQMLRWERDKQLDPKEVTAYNRLIIEVFKEAMQLNQDQRLERFGIKV